MTRRPAATRSPTTSCARCAGACAGCASTAATRSIDGALGELGRAFRLYESDPLDPLYVDLLQRFEDFAEREGSEISDALFRLNHEFPSLPGLAATRLGNALASQEHYVYTRYRIEPEVFWPRLINVLPEAVMERIKQPTILLDFAVTAASLAGLYALLWLFGGPWLGFGFRACLVATAIALVVTLGFYGLALVAARQLGQLVRAAFDQNRLALMRSLGVPRPATLREERERWQQLSQLVVFGEANLAEAFDYTLAPQPEKTE